jgi:hypothetical protein
MKLYEILMKRQTGHQSDNLSRDRWNFDLRRINLPATPKPINDELRAKWT